MADTLDLGNLMIHLKADDSQYKKVLGGSLNLMKNTMRSIMNQTQFYVKWAKRLIAAELIASVKAYSSFEEQMAKVSTMLSEQAMTFMPQYTKTLKDMSIQFGESTKTLADGLYDILSATIDPAKALDVLTVSVKAARAGMTDTKTAADAITTVLKAYQLDASKASRVSDILFATVKRGKLVFEELAQNIGKVAGTAAIAGVGFEEISAAMSTMTRAGLNAFWASTALRTMINSFISPTAEATQMAAKFGFELSSAGLRAGGLLNILAKLKGATVDELKVLMPTMRGMAGLAGVLQQASGYAYDLNLNLNSLGMSEEAFNKMTATLAFTLRRVWNQVKILSVVLGSRFREDIEALSQKFLDSRYVIEDWIVFFADRIVFLTKAMGSFIKYMFTDWKGGLKTVLDVGVILFTDFAFRLGHLGRFAGKAFSQAFAGVISEWYLEFFRASTWEKIKSPISTAVAAAFAPVADLIQRSALKGGSASLELMNAMKSVSELTTTRLKGKTLPAELADDFRRLFEELQNKDAMREQLSFWRDATRVAEGFMKEIEKVSVGVDEALGVGKVADEEFAKWELKARQFADPIEKWGQAAQDVWANIGNVAAKALNDIGDTLAEMIVRGKADFKEFTMSVAQDFLSMVLRFQMYRTIAGIPFLAPLLGGLPPGSGTANQQHPTVQHGGEILRTGWAVVHKGEKYSGVSNKFGNPPNVVINNNTGMRMEQEGAPYREADEWVVGVVVKDAHHGGPISDLLENR